MEAPSLYVLLNIIMKLETKPISPNMEESIMKIVLAVLFILQLFQIMPNGSGLGAMAVLPGLKNKFSEKDSKLLLFELGKCSRCDKLVLAAGIIHLSSVRSTL